MDAKKAIFQFCQLVLVAGIVSTLTGCRNGESMITDEAAYIESIEAWKQDRLERLKSETGWLNLAGLYWLEEGENRFGSDAANDILFPGKVPPFCGNLILKNGKVAMEVLPGVEIFHGDTTVKTLELKNDHTDQTTYLKQGDLVWYVIRRGEKYGIRLRDLKHPRIGQLDHIPSYPVSTDYVVKARLEPFDEPKYFTLNTPVEGVLEEYTCPGKLQFKLKGKELILYPFSSGNGYFLVIADETSGLDTYSAGRFMYASPDSTGHVILDFNKAYNPPCAFSPYATCPLPPRENYLPVAIEAGEKSVHID